jgi:xanthine dehydrogenase large subunit
MNDSLARCGPITCRGRRTGRAGFRGLRRRGRAAHESAHLHVAASAYTDDLPELVGTLHGALGLSPVAHVAGCGLPPRHASGHAGVSWRCSPCADIPGPNDCGAHRARRAHPGAISFADELRAALPRPAGVCGGRHTRDAARRAAALAPHVLDHRAPACGADDAGGARAAALGYVLPPMHLNRASATGVRTPRSRAHRTA